MAQRDRFRPSRAGKGERPTGLTLENNGKILAQWGQRNIPHKTVAEEEGFEPPDESPRQRFSRPPHSTTLPLLRAGVL